MTFSKYAVLTKNALFVSPVLAVIFLWVQLKEGVDKGAVFVISFLFAIFSMRYVPFFSDDKARYIERSEAFSEYSFVDYVAYLRETLRPDYLFDFLNFILSVSGVNVRYFFFLITFCTIFSILLFFKKSLRVLAAANFRFSNLIFVFIILSISLPGLFSGLRFMLAGSFFVWFIYFLFINKSVGKAAFFAFITISTHFSYSYLLVMLGLAYWVSSIGLLKALLVISFGFYLIPVSLLVSILGGVALPDGYYHKFSSYTELDRDVSKNAIILSHVRSIWFYFASLYLVFDKDKSNKILLSVLLLLISSVNFVSSIPVAFYRYIGFVKVLFLLYFLSKFVSGRLSNSYFYCFFVLYALGFIIDVLVLRVNFQESFFSSESLLTVLAIYFEDSVHEVMY
tara:strand:+ start:6537 stop:7724 length:1188 start_codon:yes stop_codon:yes gene_type:complete